MTATDPAQALCDLLLGAAYADDHLHENEKDFVRAHLVALCGGELPPDLAARIDAFDRERFDLDRTVAAFAADSHEQKRAILELVAALHDTDEELDLAEDDYLRELARALGAEDALEGLALDYETEKLRASCESLRIVLPPPVPSS
jgi:uncharacterized tellurite resistance protein B-like protein